MDMLIMSIHPGNQEEHFATDFRSSVMKPVVASHRSAEFQIFLNLLFCTKISSQSDGFVGLPAKARFIVGLVRGRGYSAVKDDVVCEYKNTKFVVNRWGGLAPLALRFYEPMVSRLIRSSSGEVFVDVGANVGAYTLFGAPRFQRVLAVEPGIIARRMLERNLIINHVQNVTVDARVVGTRIGLMKLYHSPAIGNWGLIPYDKSQEFDLVEAVTLGDLLSEYRRVDLIKIDVEGSELDVVRSAEDSLQNVSEIIIEVRDRYIEGVAQMLESAGFAGYILEDRPEARERNLLFSRRRYSGLPSLEGRVLVRLASNQEFERP
jgi:FkbM family methyltransferase